MGRPKKDTSADELRVLEFVRDTAPGPRSAAVASNADLAGALGCSLAKAKVLKRAMIDKGLLEATERWADNGGQLESSYRITRSGRRLLANHEGELEALPR